MTEKSKVTFIPSGEKRKVPKSASTTGSSTYRVPAEDVTITTTSGGGTKVQVTPKVEEQSESGGGSRTSSPTTGSSAPNQSESWKEIAKERHEANLETVYAQSVTAKKSRGGEPNQSESWKEIASERYRKTHNVNIAVDKEAVDSYNAYNKALGIDNAAEYFEAVKALPKEMIVTGSEEVNRVSMIQAPPRTVSPQETMEINDEVNYQNPFPTREYGGVVNAYNPDVAKTSLKSGVEETYARYKIATERPGNELLMMSRIPVGIAYGAVTGGRVLAESAIYLIDKAPKGTNLLNPTKVGTFIYNDVVGGTIEGTGELLGETVSAVESGSLPRVSEKGGEILSMQWIGGKVGKGAEALYRGVRNIPNRARWIEATEFQSKGEVENPMFRREFEDLGIDDVNPQVKAPPEYYYIPTEYTELGKNLEKVEGKPIDAAAGEAVPGTYLEVAQPADFVSSLEYKRLGNIPPEMQTRLSTEKRTPGRELMTPQELLDLQNNPRSVQQKLIQPPVKRDFFNSAEWRAKEILAKAAKEQEVKGPDGKLYTVDPITASLITIIDNRQRISDTLKGKYKTYKESLSVVGDTVVTEFSAARPRPGLIIRTSVDVSSRSNLTPITSVGLVSQQSVSQEPAVRIRSRSQQDQGLASGLRVSQSQDQSQRQGLAQSTALVQEPVQQTRQIQRQAPITETPQPRKPILPRVDNRDSESGSSAPTIVKVRRGGVFQTIGSFEDAEDALELGRKVVRNTAAASFKLEQSGQIVDDVEAGFDFTPSKRERGVFVQKREKRISTGGEKAEITFKGIGASKARKKRRDGLWL